MTYIFVVVDITYKGVFLETKLLTTHIFLNKLKVIIGNLKDKCLI